MSRYVLRSHQFGTYRRDHGKVLCGAREYQNNRQKGRSRPPINEAYVISVSVPGIKTTQAPGTFRKLHLEFTNAIYLVLNGLLLLRRIRI